MATPQRGHGLLQARPRRSAARLPALILQRTQFEALMRCKPADLDPGVNTWVLCSALPAATHQVMVCSVSLTAVLSAQQLPEVTASNKRHHACCCVVATALPPYWYSCAVKSLQLHKLVIMFRMRCKSCMVQECTLERAVGAPSHPAAQVPAARCARHGARQDGLQTHMRPSTAALCSLPAPPLARPALLPAYLA